MTKNLFLGGLLRVSHIELKSSLKVNYHSMFVCFNHLILNLSHRIRDEFDVLSLPSEGGFGTPQIKTIAPVKGQLISK